MVEEGERGEGEMVEEGGEWEEGGGGGRWSRRGRREREMVEEGEGPRLPGEGHRSNQSKLSIIFFSFKTWILEPIFPQTHYTKYSI